MNIQTWKFTNETDIAIVGMAGRFPQANDLEQFWANLRDGRESISFFSESELREAGANASELASENYVPARAILNDVTSFDAGFFGLTPKEAELMDPQQRLLLECAWKALEDAGYDTDRYEGATGVYTGAGLSTYALNFLTNPQMLQDGSGFQALLSNDKDYVATLVAYKLNLQGPGITVQTACSTSLVAVHLACQSLLTGECDMALAGGSSIGTPQKRGYLFENDGVHSPDGHCRAFDVDAQGMVEGNGVGVVVLKRIEDALVDGDHVYAVIKGTAVNNDGGSKVGYTAPSVAGQARVITEALAVANVSPETVTYVETHGTATPLGDPVEITALTKAFANSSTGQGSCAIGSVKTNIGHLGAAAGIAGLMKTVLALIHRQIPPSLHFQQPNPAIDFANSPFYVNTQLRDWQPAADAPRRAGVSAFGIGGTNAHVILEEAPPLAAETAVSRSHHILLLSAKTETALEAATDNLSTYLAQHSSQNNLADIAYTLQVGRRAWTQRRFVVCRDRQEGATLLQERQPNRVFTQKEMAPNKPVAFLFSGTGEHYVHMARGLYDTEPVFRESFDRCATILRPYLETDIHTILYPGQVYNGARTAADMPEIDLRQMLQRDTQTPDPDSEQLNQTQYLHPIVFVVEYCLAQQWMAWGIQPQAVIGHSLGEFMAACIAGIFSLEDALKLIAQRARLIQSLPVGGMLAVPLSQAEIVAMLPPTLSLAAVNQVDLCVVSGPAAEIDTLERQLTGKGIISRRLHTIHALHSTMMTAVIAPLMQLMASVTLNPPQIPYVSNVTGTWITPEQATDPHYWAGHCCQTVNFADGIANLFPDEYILLELGPGQSLGTMAVQQAAHLHMHMPVALPSLRHAYTTVSDTAFLLTTLGKLWLHGVVVDWDAYYALETRHRLALPTYPFDRQPYWIGGSTAVLPQNTPTATQQKATRAADWFYMPVWQQTPLPPAVTTQLAGQEHWVLFRDNCGVSDAFAEALPEDSLVFTVKPGNGFTADSDSRAYTVNPQESADFAQLMAALAAIPDVETLYVIYFWGVTETAVSTNPDTMLADSGFTTLMTLLQTLNKYNLAQQIRLQIITNHMTAISVQETICPAKSLLAGICTVIAQEYMDIATQIIDVFCPETAVQQQILVDQLRREIGSPIAGTLVAYRGRQRWQRRFDPVNLEIGGMPHIEPHGVYFIPDGLTPPHNLFARYLTQMAPIRLVLTDTAELPPQAAWDTWLSTHDTADSTSQKLRVMQELTASGAEILVLPAGTGDGAAMEGAMQQAEAAFGQISGIIFTPVPLDELAVHTIADIQPAFAQQYFQTYVQRLLVVERLVNGRSPAFCLLNSSLTSILGGPGFALNAALSAFTDAFVQQHQDAQTEWICVNWDRWQFQENDPSTTPNLALAKEEGLDVFNHVLHSDGFTQLVVSTTDLAARIRQWVALQTRTSSAQTDIPTLFTNRPRPNLQTPYTAPETEAEETIVAIWERLLGTEPVGIHDNFFELGGHSLLGAQLITQLRHTFQVDISLRLLFESPTVADQALMIEDIILAELEDLGEEIV